MNAKLVDKLFRAVIPLAFLLGAAGTPPISAQAQSPNPGFIVFVGFGDGRVEGWGWPQGATITVTVDDPGTPESPDITRTTEAYEAGWNPGLYRFDLDLRGVIDIRGGFVITATDGSVTKSHVVVLVGFPDVDLHLDVVAGIAEPGQTVSVGTCNPRGCVRRRAVANQNGNWSANFADPGDGTWEQETADIRNGSTISVLVADEDGDSTMWTWRVPDPGVYVSAKDESVWGSEWPQGATITVTVDDPNSPQAPDIALTAEVSVWSSFHVDLRGVIDIQRGFVVTATDGSAIKSHVVMLLEFTSVDLDLDVVTGVAEPGQAFGIWTCYHGPPCVHRWVVADQNGSWSANFAVPGDKPWEQETADIRNGSSIYSSVTDEDGDSTIFEWHVPNPTDIDGDGQQDLLDPCPGDPTNACNPEGSVAGVIGPAGGVLTTDNNQVSLNVPSGALTETMVLSVTDAGGGYEVATHEGTMSVFQSYSIQPHGTHFEKPITITFHWNDSDNNGIVDGTSLRESRILLIKDGLIMTPSCAVNPDCDVNANTLTIQVTDLSLFELAVPANRPPVAEVGPNQTIFFGDTVTLTASASSDPDNDALTYEWDLDNDGQYDDANGVTTRTTLSQVGQHIVGLRVTDTGGLSGTDTTTITVLPWTLNGFYHPVDMNAVYNVVKGGSTVPLKFEILAGTVEVTNTAYVKRLSYVEIACDANAITDEIELTATGDTRLRYDTQSGQFIYNWETPKAPRRCFRVTLTTQDGSVLLAYFKLR